MHIFGWIMLSLLAIFGLAILIIFVIPFITTEFKMMSEKIKRSIDDKKFDLDKRSEERRHRDEIKRKRDFELANKKLDAKLLKVDKQIELQTKKLELAKELKQATSNKLEELNKEKSTTTVDNSIKENKTNIKIESAVNAEIDNDDKNNYANFISEMFSSKD